MGVFVQIFAVIRQNQPAKSNEILAKGRKSTVEMVTGQPAR